MTSGWRYRLASLFGAISLAVVAVAVANVEVVQAGFSLLPVIGHLPFDPALGEELVWEATTAAVVLVAALVPLFKPRPRRILDTAELESLTKVILASATAHHGIRPYHVLVDRSERVHFVCFQSVCSAISVHVSNTISGSRSNS